MSQASANAFVNRMRTDRDFAARVSKANKKEERWAVLRASGFEFTEDEFRTTFDAMMGEVLPFPGESALRASGTKEARRSFVPPEVQKHTAIAAIAGSGDHSCTYAPWASMYSCDYPV